MPRPPEHDPKWLLPWFHWVRAGRPRGHRPKDAPARIPDWAWEAYGEWDRKQHKPPHKPPPPPPPPAKPAPSWTLTNGPWIFVESDPGSCRPGPWTRLDIQENRVGPGAPLWWCAKGRVPQMEGRNQGAACLEYCKQLEHGVDVAPVTTLGIDPAPFLNLGVTSVFVECYLQSSEIALRKLWGAGHEGWPDPIAVIGAGFADQAGTFHVRDYLEPRRFAANGEEIGWPGLRALGTRFGVYASDAMSDDDWAVLAELAA